MPRHSRPATPPPDQGGAWSVTLPRTVSVARALALVDEITGGDGAAGCLSCGDSGFVVGDMPGAMALRRCACPVATAAAGADT